MHDPFLSRHHYRRLMAAADLVSFRVSEKESDLHIQAFHDLSTTARKELVRLRREIGEYIAKYPEFHSTLLPWPDDPTAPALIRQMIHASQTAGVGPMAAIAGTLAEALGKKLLQRSAKIIVENGGDLFVCSDTEVTIGLYAGDSPFSGRIGLKIPPPRKGMGICTSSGRLGHSISFGKADAAVIISKDTAVADALATAMGNKIQKPEDIEPLVEKAKDIKEISAMVLVKGDRLGVYGEIEMVPLQ
ncbi:hypothetical protein LZ24_00214 [Desulfobotulus alkaliphilus]|uniref:Uncharacterized protein n=1 Tax=Desulfobotulus alkaliphilus TaxID=622671 RepID=A0A562S9E4_9BACT|nr:UPF0280 family protein [Desulfobotulus alkaliphilus]TWI77404.1 hypothetical protein LZ24_00214 [Desulfobotulus alkaliphilus]